ncbi:MAG: Gfo/Idh/MocA family protein, partial [bacterium]
MFEVITGRKLRIAIIGCGRISRNHFGSIQKHAEDLELVAVCDTDSAKLEEHQSEYNVPGYSDLKTLLEHEKPDLV